EASLTALIPHLIENRQTRQFNRQSSIDIAGPVQRDAAPGVPGRDGAENTPIGIERERLGDFAPQSAEPSGGSRADQRREFVGNYREANFGIHLPHEAQ